jgi:hypothetical protein
MDMYRKVPETTACMVATAIVLSSMLDSNAAATIIPMGVLTEKRYIIFLNVSLDMDVVQAAVKVLPRANPANTLWKRIAMDIETMVCESDIPRTNPSSKECTLKAKVKATAEAAEECRCFTRCSSS